MTTFVDMTKASFCIFFEWNFNLSLKMSIVQFLWNHQNIEHDKMIFTLTTTNPGLHKSGQVIFKKVKQAQVACVHYFCIEKDKLVWLPRTTMITYHYPDIELWTISLEFSEYCNKLIGKSNINKHVETLFSL